MGQLKPVQTHTKNMCNMFVASLRTLCRLPLPCVVAVLPFYFAQQAPREVTLKTSPGTMSCGGPATNQKVVRASSQGRANL